MYLGNTPTQQAFTPVVDTFSGNGSTTAFTLSRSVAAVAQVEAVIENVVQSPVDAYTVSGNTITFTSAPPSGSSNIYVRYTSPITQVMQPTDGSVGLRQLNSDLQGATYGMKNRIINGAMAIDQRNAGASVSVNSGTGQYAVDRFVGIGQATDGVFSMQQVADAPSGFRYSLKATITTADASIGAAQYYCIEQRIEGNNVADLMLGVSSSQQFTLSFWAKSSVTGTFGGSVGNNNDISYPFNYTISSANTWEYKTVTITSTTSGTWATNNTTGLMVVWSLGVGSNWKAAANTWANYPFAPTGSLDLISTLNATLQITGVQLEKGSTATSFDYRPYGTELALCQRYCFVQQATGANYSFGVSSVNSTLPIGLVAFPVPMRTAPTSATLSAANTFSFASGAPTAVAFDSAGATFGVIYGSGGTGGTAGFSGRFMSANSSAQIIWPAEL